MTSLKRTNRSPLAESPSHETKRAHTGQDGKTVVSDLESNKRTQHHGAVPMDSENLTKKPTAATTSSLADSTESQRRTAAGAHKNAQVLADSEQLSTNTTIASATKPINTTTINNKQTLISAYQQFETTTTTPSKQDTTTEATTVIGQDTTKGWTTVAAKKTASDKLASLSTTSDGVQSATKSNLRASPVDNQTGSKNQTNSRAASTSRSRSSERNTKSGAKTSASKVTKNSSAQSTDGSPAHVARSSGNKTSPEARMAAAAKHAIVDLSLKGVGRSRYHAQEQSGKAAKEKVKAARDKQAAKDKKAANDKQALQNKQTAKDQDQAAKVKDQAAKAKAQIDKEKKETEKVIGFGFEAVKHKERSRSGSSKSTGSKDVLSDQRSVTSPSTDNDEMVDSSAQATLEPGIQTPTARITQQEMEDSVTQAQDARKTLQQVHRSNTAIAAYTAALASDEPTEYLNEEERIIGEMANIANKFDVARKKGEENLMELDMPNGGEFQQIGTMTLPPTTNVVVHEVHNAILDEIGQLPRSRKHVARFSLQLSIPPSDDPEAEIHKAIVDVLQKFKTMDSKIVLYPYRAADCIGKVSNPEIVDFARFPKRFAAMRPYLYGLSDKFVQGNLYTSIYLATEKAVDVFLSEASSWLRTTSHGGMYLHHVQAENMAVVGWMLYSMQTMDLSRLQSELETRLCFAVQARYQIINTGRNKDLKEEDKIKAIHLRVDANLQDEAREILGEIYSSSSKSFPLGHCMRMIPPVNQMMNPVNSTAFEELRCRQRAFQDSMIRILSYEVASLFTDSHNVSLHLHDRLMNIQSPSFKGVPLFHCVDKPSPNAPVSLFCHPRDESFARSVTAGMVAYVRHFARKDQNFEPYSVEENDYISRQVYRFFKTSAVKRSMGCEWCEETKGVISPSITNALDSLTSDGRFDFEQQAPTPDAVGMVRAVDKKVVIVEPPNQYQINEEDSIKTFREMTTGKRAASGIRSRAAAQSSRTDSTDNEAASVGSRTTSSNVTKQSRSSRSTKSSLTASDLTSVTMSVATLSSNVSALQSQFEQMMKMFPVLAAQAVAENNNLTTPVSKLNKKETDSTIDMTEYHSATDSPLAVLDSSSVPVGQNPPPEATDEGAPT
jgi:hypothetical protein